MDKTLRREYNHVKGHDALRIMPVPRDRKRGGSRLSESGRSWVNCSGISHYASKFLPNWLIEMEVCAENQSNLLPEN
jgi:hypothetical protein